MIKRQDSSQFVIEKECMLSNRAITQAQIAKIEEKISHHEVERKQIQAEIAELCSTKLTLD
jgi:cell division protein FtsL